MKAVFADAFFFIALVNPKDGRHQRAVEFSKTHRRHLVTTTWVLTELADGLGKPPNRRLFRKILQDFERTSHAEIVWPDEAQWRQGVELYDSRQDKQWSLTDCISFVVMQEHGIVEALTGDQHFEQAGFVALLK